jgi:hypothetical protein
MQSPVLRNYPFYEIYNNINAILRLLQTKESVSKYVELMLQIKDLWHGYMEKKEMKKANMIPFFQAICDIVFTLNKRIQMTRIKLINNDQERVTYMINFLEGVLEDIKKYGFSVFKLYEHVLGLLESYNPPELKPLHPEHVPEEEEEVEDGGDGGVNVFDGGEGEPGHVTEDSKTEDVRNGNTHEETKKLLMDLKALEMSIDQL